MRNGTQLPNILQTLWAPHKVPGMEMFRRHWVALVGAISFLPALCRLARSILDYAGYYDLITSHIKEPGWVAGVLSILLNPPPQAILPLFLVGGFLIWWDLRESGRNRSVQVNFINKTTEDLDVFWQRPDGAVVFYRRLAKCCTYSVDTYPRHIWIVRNVAGAELTRYPTKGGVLQDVILQG